MIFEHESSIVKDAKIDQATKVLVYIFVFSMNEKRFGHKFITNSF